MGPSIPGKPILRRDFLRFARAELSIETSLRLQGAPTTDRAPWPILAVTGRPPRPGRSPSARLRHRSQHAAASGTVGRRNKQGLHRAGAHPWNQDEQSLSHRQGLLEPAEISKLQANKAPRVSRGALFVLLENGQFRAIQFMIAIAMKRAE